MPAMQKLLIDALVTAATISRSQLGRDHEAVVILFVLTGRRLMTIQAVHAFLRMLTHFVFVHDRVLRARGTPHTFPSRVPIPQRAAAFRPMAALG